MTDPHGSLVATCVLCACVCVYGTRIKRERERERELVFGFMTPTENLAVVPVRLMMLDKQQKWKERVIRYFRFSSTIQL